ncbi:MAG: 50S ribosomal protein L1 [Deltaproteobacteria bacterium]|nr:MAG: 50S ribosomal protein L1 [Deltaproteobacteria bacterium]
MAKHGKRFVRNIENIDAQKRYDIGEAFSLLKTLKGAKFDETVEVSVRLGVDPKKSDQMVRGVVRLPHGTGRSVRILVFAKGDKEQEARDAGADHVGAEDMVQKIQGGWLDFDKCIATPDMMPKVGPIAKILGPRGLMPNPKVGTVTVDVARAVREEKAGRIEFRVEKAGIVHAPLGKLSFEASNLEENFRALLEQVGKQKPATSKGNYIQSISISSTMGPGIKIDPSKVAAAEAA